MKKFTCYVLSVPMILSLVACSQSSHSNNLKTSSITSSDNSEGENIEITIPTLGENYWGNLKKYAEMFNKENKGYKIVFKDYGNDEELINDDDFENLSNFYDSTDEMISLDIMKGNTIDIIPKSIFHNTGRYEELLAKGAFTDLYEFMNDDPNINRSIFFEQVLQAFENEGKLYTMPECFKINTLAGYSKYVGTKENWTLQELMEHWNNMQVEATFNGEIRSDGVYRCVLQGYVNQFFDLKNGNVNFNSPEFINALEFCNSFPKPEDYKNDNQSEKFLFPVEILSFENYHMQLSNENNEEITFVGYPTSDGSGSFISAGDSEFAISALSSPEVQNAAWEFMSTFLDYDYQYGNYGFPINKKAFEDRGREVINNAENETITRQGIEYIRKPFTEDEYKRLVDFIPTVNKKQNNIDAEIFKIIDEEVMSMLYGEKNEKETAEIIQNRVSILVSEKY